MTTDKEFFNVKYKEGSLDPKTAQLIFFAVCISIGHEEGAMLHLKKARECGASEDDDPKRRYTRWLGGGEARDPAKTIIAK